MDYLLKNRVAPMLIRLGLSLAAIAFTLLNLPDQLPQNAEGWLVIISLTGLVIAVQALAIDIGVRRLSFLPAVVLLVYVVLGRDTAMLVTTVGLVIAGSVYVWLRFNKPNYTNESLVDLAAQEAYAVFRNVVCLVVADWVYGAVRGAGPPLGTIASAADVLPFIGAATLYLIFYNLLKAVDLWLSNASFLAAYRDHWRSILSTQVLPVLLVPLAAVSLTTTGIWAFLVIELALLAIAIAIFQLQAIQLSLQKQVRQLNSFSAMNRALRTSLNLNSLLENVYLQSRNLIQTRNLQIILRHSNEESNRWSLEFAVSNGQHSPFKTTIVPDGPTQWILDNHLPLLIDPVFVTPGMPGMSALPEGARSWMGVPLIISNRVLGAIVTWLDLEHSESKHHLTPDDLEMFTAIAIQTGVALENSLLYDESQAYAKRLARLNQISTEMNASLDPDKVLELVAASVIDVAECSKAALYLLEQDSADSTEMSLAYAKGFAKGYMARAKEITIPFSDFERYRVIRDGQIITARDIYDPEASIPPATRRLAEQEHFSAYAYVPLRAQNKPIGMLAIYYTQPHDFTVTELEILATFANQAALAVANARIYHRVDVQLTHRIDQIVRLAEFSRRLSATLDMQTVFDLIITTAMRDSRAESAILVLSDDERDLSPHAAEPRGVSMVAWRGYNPASGARPPHQAAHELIASPVLTKGEILYVNDPMAGTNRPASQIAVPIYLEERIIGALALESSQPDIFAHDDVEYIGQLAVQAAIAIRNAQLYNHTEIVRDRLEAILDTSYDGLLMIDQQSRIVMTNTRMGNFWDFARADFGASSPEKFLADPLTALGEGLGYQQGELQELLSQSLRSKDNTPSTDLYVTNARYGERQRFVERTVLPVLDSQGEFMGLLLRFRDITEQKELEQAREDLTSMMIHDLRGPLTAVMTSMALIGKAAPDNHIAQQAASNSLRATKKVLNMVNDLLDVSRLSVGQTLSIDRTINNVRALLEDAVAEMKPVADQINIDMEIICPEDIPAGLYDRNMIERVLINLLDNALKYTRADTSITLRASLMEHESRQTIRVDVIDQGPGVPEEYKKVIFDRFKQVPGLKGRRHSAGIGLAFCRMALDAHEGDIWVEDNPNGGSIFSLTLPVAAMVQLHPHATDTAESPPTGYTGSGGTQRLLSKVENSQPTSSRGPQEGEGG